MSYIKEAFIYAIGYDASGNEVVKISFGPYYELTDEEKKEKGKWSQNVENFWKDYNSLTSDKCNDRLKEMQLNGDCVGVVVKWGKI